MARRARKVSAMIQRFVWQTGMHVDVRNPGDRFVTIIAFAVRNKVALVPTGRDDAVVARGTGAKDLRMIHRHHGAPDGRAVAVFAHIGR